MRCVILVQHVSFSLKLGSFHGLPLFSLKKLEHLYFIKDEKDMQEKYRETAKWFREIISEIDPREMEKLVGM